MGADGGGGQQGGGRGELVDTAEAKDETLWGAGRSQRSRQLEFSESPPRFLCKNGELGSPVSQRVTLPEVT